MWTEHVIKGSSDKIERILVVKSTYKERMFGGRELIKDAEEKYYISILL